MSQPIEPAAPPEKHDAYAALRLPVYRRFAGTQVFATLASQIISTAILFQLFQLTGSDEANAWLGLVMALPVLLLALVAGQVSDIFSRKYVLLTMQAVLSVCPLVLAYRLHHGLLTPGWVYAVMGFNAVALTFARPARSSLLPQIISRSVLPNAITWNSSIFELSSITGPALGGLLLMFGAKVPLIAGSGLMFACFLLTTTLPNPGPAKNREPLNMDSLLEGVKFVFRTRLMLAAILFDLLAVFFAGVAYLLPGFAEKQLHVGELGFGLMRSAPAVGALTMALIQAHRGPFVKAGRALLLAVLGFGAVTIVFALSRNIYLSLAMLFLTGMLDNISVVLRSTLEQLLTPDAMRGRVNAVTWVFVGSSNELGGFFTGMAATQLGRITSVVLGGSVSMLVTLTMAKLFPELRRLGKLEEITPVKEHGGKAGLAQEPA